MAKIKINENELANIINKSIRKVNEGQGWDTFKKGLSLDTGDFKNHAKRAFGKEGWNFIKTGDTEADPKKHYYDPKNPVDGTFNNKTSIDQNGNVHYDNMDTKPINKGKTGKFSRAAGLVGSVAGYGARCAYDAIKDKIVKEEDENLDAVIQESINKVLREDCNEGFWNNIKAAGKGIGRAFTQGGGMNNVKAGYNKAMAGYANDELNNMDANQPQAIDDEKIKAIKQKYQVQINKLYQQMRAAVKQAKLDSQAAQDKFNTQRNNLVQKQNNYKANFNNNQNAMQQSRDERLEEKMIDKAVNESIRRILNKK